ncbi:HlyD family secretion protein [Pseudoxanthomonas sp. 10H]|uniref:HlyD family secretion protein n=1 Tax=Pseudoxanthomonas sp. 10H TaxID=3242729 RepID=UPI003555CE5C
MSQDLFRREVMEARRHGWLGHISLVQPVRLRVLALGAGLAAAAVVLFLLTGTYTRRSTVAGQLVPSRGLATVVAPASGVVSRLEVAEGGRVRQGQALATVAVPRATLAEGDTFAALERRLASRREGLVEERAARQALLAAQDAGLRAQLAAAEREGAQLDAEVATRREQVRIAGETLQRLRPLQEAGYVGLLQLRQQESNVLSWRGEMQALQRQSTATRRTIAQLRQSLAELPGQAMASDAGLRQELARLEQEQLETRARGALVVNAPVAGSVSAQLAKAGQAVQAGQPLLSLLPADGGLEAELLVPSRAIGFVEPGDEVLLRYHAFPYQKFGHQRGRVVRISRSALDPADIGPVAGQPQAREPRYRVTVALARQAVTAFGNEEPLRPGMLLDADILGERRRLIEWVFEPLYSVRGRIGDG